MPTRTWGRRRERQYEYIKARLTEHGGPPLLAVAEVEGHLAPSARPRAARTKAQLYAEARRRNIEGRSTMSKAQLERAVA